MRLTLGKKLGLGFGAVLALMALSALGVYLSILRMNASILRVTDDAVPAVRAADEILSGLHHSSAALRGYVLLGDDKKHAELFKQDRQKAVTAINAAMDRLERLYRDSADAEVRRRFAAVRDGLGPFFEAQKGVEAIAHTEGNVKSLQTLRGATLPLGEKLLGTLTALMDAEDALAPTADRKKLLKTMADCRACFIRAMEQVVTYLYSGQGTFKRAFEEQWAGHVKALKSLEGQSKLLTGKQADDWEALKRHHAAFEPMPATLFKERDADDWDQAVHKMETVTAPQAFTIREALEALKQTAVGRMAEERKTMEAASTAVTTTLLASTLLAIAAGTGIAVWLSRQIAVGLQTLLAGVQAVAAGDLSRGAVTVTSDDELGDLAGGFNGMVGSLRGILGEIASVTNETAAASRQIAAAAQQQLASLDETAASLNAITATAEEFKATMQEFADRARAVKEAAAETARRAADGRALTQDSASRLQQVRGNAQAAGQSVYSLTEQMERIGEITATVNEVAEQTKLLALNASIEAARAGENGRGFAVVATQVRELANQSKESAGRIEALIAETQKSMQAVVGKIQEGGRLSDDSAEIGRKVAQAFEEIAQAIELTREAMTQISTGTRQQEQGIGELVSGITQIDSASKQSVVSAGQTQKAILAIDGRIQALSRAASKFKT